MKHSLTLEDRGTNHVHRFKPSCSCGWIGVPLRDSARAQQEYRNHVNREDRINRGGTRRKVSRSKGGKHSQTVRRIGKGRAGPRPVTPHDQLPPELQ